MAALSVFVVACSTTEPLGDCLAPEDGAFVSSSCDVPEGITPLPTDTPLSSASGSGGGDPGFVAFRAAGCAACHAIDGTAANGMLGPNLTTVGAQGEAYVRESILMPGAVIAEGFTDGIMPVGFGSSLSPEQLDSIVGWLMGQ